MKKKDMREPIIVEFPLRGEWLAPTTPGNSFSPHLHFQLMDSSDLPHAQGLPCAFKEYELFQDGQWKRVMNGIPGDKDRIRFVCGERNGYQNE